MKENQLLHAQIERQQGEIDALKIAVFALLGKSVSEQFLWATLPEALAQHESMIVSSERSDERLSGFQGMAKSLRYAVRKESDESNHLAGLELQRLDRGRNS